MTWDGNIPANADAMRPYIFGQEDAMTEFGKLDPDGGYEHVRTLDQAAIWACPHTIMVPEHYRTDGRCRCTDRDHAEMREWGYTWSEQEGRWT